ncbi:MAG: transposase, partial [Nitrospinota bacterium]
FLLTVTLLEQFRNIARSHQKIACAALFSCIYEALKKLAKDKRFAGSSRIGFLLRTWRGMPRYHTHLYLIRKNKF